MLPALELALELREANGVPLDSTSTPDPREVDVVPMGDLDRDGETLAIGPVKEGRETIAAGIRRRERQRRPTGRPQRHRPHVQVGAYAERPAGKLDPEGRPRMHVAVSLPSEFESRHRVIEAREIDVAGEDEIHVLRGEESSGVDPGAGPTRQDRSDPVAGERFTDRDGHLLERSARRDFQGGLPVARGRRRSRLTPDRNSGSASASRARYDASSRRAK